MLPVELWEPRCKFSSLPVDREYQMRQSKDNYKILLFNSKYKHRSINVIFQQDKHNIYYLCNKGVKVFGNLTIFYFQILNISIKSKRSYKKY
jgi:hypothetical protein